MIRRAARILLVAIAALLPAGVALAAFTQTADTRLSAERAGRSTGITADVHASDPTALGTKPRSVRRLVITFPAGTRFNLASPLVTDCRLTDKQLTTEFGPSCPRASRIGEGTAIANIAPMTPYTVPESVAAYVRGAHQAILVVKPALPADLTEIMPVTVSGPRLTITVPRVVWVKIVHVVLVSLKLDGPAMGSGSSALITSGACSDGRFVVTSHFVYADPGTLDVRSSSPCR